MTKDETHPLGKRWLWFVFGTLGLAVMLLGSAFSQAWYTNTSLQGQMLTAAPMLTAEVKRQVTLQYRLSYVRSEAYVDEWARVHAGMVHPGEVLVVPLLPTPTLTPFFTPVPVVSTPAPVPFWNRWWSALIGK